MSAITVRPFRRSDRDQLTDLVNGHAHAVMPGVSITVNAVLSQLEHEPDEFIVDPWVQERITLVAEQRGRITAAAHMVRYADRSGVGPDLRGTGELRWLLQWPDASYWPDAHRAGRSVADAALTVMRSWSVRPCWPISLSRTRPDRRRRAVAAHRSATRRTRVRESSKRAGTTGRRLGLARRRP